MTKRYRISTADVFDRQLSTTIASTFVDEDGELTSQLLHMAKVFASTADVFTSLDKIFGPIFEEDAGTYLEEDEDGAFFLVSDNNDLVQQALSESLLMEVPFAGNDETDRPYLGI